MATNKETLIQKITNIANAIRNAGLATGKMSLDQMPASIAKASTVSIDSTAAPSGSYNLISTKTRQIDIYKYHFTGVGTAQQLVSSGSYYMASGRCVANYGGKIHMFQMTTNGSNSYHITWDKKNGFKTVSDNCPIKTGNQAVTNSGANKATVVDGYVYILYAASNTGDVVDVYEYDGSTYRKTAALPSGSRGVNCVPFIYKGKFALWTSDRKFYTYNRTADSWTFVTTPPGTPYDGYPYWIHNDTIHYYLQSSSSTNSRIYYSKIVEGGAMSTFTQGINFSSTNTNYMVMYDEEDEPFLFGGNTSGASGANFTYSAANVAQTYTFNSGVAPSTYNGSTACFCLYQENIVMIPTYYSSKGLYVMAWRLFKREIS